MSGRLACTILFTLLLVISGPVRGADNDNILTTMPDSAGPSREQEIAAAWISAQPARRGSLITPDTVTDQDILNVMRQYVETLLATHDITNANPDFVSSAPERARRPRIDTLGPTLLYLYALLETGKAVPDPRLRADSPELSPIIDAAVNAHTYQTYETALQACILGVIPAKPALAGRAKLIGHMLVAGARAKGGYTYGLVGGINAMDNSNTHFGLLGIWAASEAGFEPPVTFLEKEDRYWRSSQDTTGGWGYIPHELAPTPSMTAAGVASLLVLANQWERPAEVNTRPDAAIESGMDWLDQHFADMRQFSAYTLFALERVGLISGRTHFGNENWYRSMAARLVDSHAMANDDDASPDHFSLTDTAFHLLTLARGRFPVVFNKLEYAGHWDNRPLDVSNVTHYLSKEMEVPINWQIAELASDPIDWTDAPVLVIMGQEDPHFTPADLEKLRRFILAGGIIFSSADGSSAEFSAAMAKYAPMVVDKFRPLPADHPLYNVVYKITKPPALLGISNGIREVWIHSPGDIGADWQERKYLQGKESFQFAINLAAYAFGNSRPHSKLLRTQPVAAPQPGRQMGVARITYAGKWDPEPGAWPHFAQFSRAELDLDMTVQPVAPVLLKADQFQLAHLTGAEAFSLPVTDRILMRAYLDNGGTLLADAAGGHAEFTKSFLELAKFLYPLDPLETIPADSPILKDLATVNYRKFTHTLKGLSNVPRLMGLKQGNRYVIIFSEDDLSSGLLGSNTWGISGYASDSAEALAQNIIRYVEAQHK